MKRILPITILILFLCSPVWAATYYVRNGGNDSASGADNANAWAHCPGMIGWTGSATLSAGDTVLFAQGDTWSFSPGGSPLYSWLININGLTVNSYNNGGGAGKPIFDSQTTFASNPLTGNRHRWDRFIEITASDVTIQNLEIKRHYGNGIMWTSVDNATIDSCIIYEIGMTGITKENSSGTNAAGCTVQHCEVYNCQRLEELDYVDYMWSGGIAMATSAGQSVGNTVRYNYVHDIYGEGIICREGVVEYNVVVNTWSVGIGSAPQASHVTTDTDIRYNLVLQIAGGFRSGNSEGIVVIDETDGYTCTGDFNIYGNIIIGAQQTGIQWRDSEDWDDPWEGTVRIYNNMIIDSLSANIYVADTDNLSGVNGKIYIYNNTSIYYDQSGQVHIWDDATIPNANVIISDNHFWDQVAGSYGTVDSDWQTNYATGDPKLPGEPAVNWDGLTGRSDVDFDIHLYPLSDSALVNNGKTLSSPYVVLFLTTGTDYDDLPGTSTFESILQGDHGAWDIGAIIYKDPADDPPTMRSLWNFDVAPGLLVNSINTDYNLTNNGSGVNVVELSATHKQGDRSADFETDNDEFLSFAGSVNDFSWDTDLEFTMCMWCRAEDTVLGNLMSKGVTGTSDYEFSIDVEADGTPGIWIGHTNGTASEELDFTGANIVIGIWYHICVAYNGSGSTSAGLADKELRIRIWDDNAGALLGGSEETPSSANAKSWGEGGDFQIGAYNSLNQWDGLIDEVLIYDRCLTSAEMDDLRGGIENPSFTNSTAPTATYSTDGDTVTVTITKSTEAFTEGGIPYAALETGYEDAIAYYIEKTATTIILRATLIYGMRTTDLVWKDANITLPAGCTMKNAAGDAFTLTLPDAGAITNTTVVAIPGSATDPITVGSGADIAKISDMSHQLANDVYQYLEPVTDNVDITVNGVTISGIGRTQVNTGTMDFTGSNIHVRCVNFSGAVTGAGANGNTYHPICSRGSSRMGMNPR